MFRISFKLQVAFSVLFTFLLISSCNEEGLQSHEKLEEDPYQLLHDQMDEFLDIKSRKLTFHKGFKLASDELRQDLLHLKGMMEEYQIPLYRYASKSEIDSVFAKALNMPDDSTDYFEFIGNLAHVFSTLGCMHSGWGHAQYYKDYRKDNLKIFPFEVFLDEGHLYILENYSMDLDLKPGMEILSINNQGIDEIVEELSNCMAADGRSDNVRRKAVSDYFRMAYSNFVARPDYFELEISDNGQNFNFTIPALKLASIDSTKLSRYSSPVLKDKASMKISLIDSISTAVYTIKSFRNEILNHQGINFEAFNNSVFELLNERNIDNLIIDLRDNYGGWTGNGRELFSYFIEEETPYIKSVQVSTDTSFKYDELLTSPNPYQDTMDLEDGFWNNYPNLIAYPKSKNGYKGKTYILVNENSKSCSSIFSSLMRANTEAIFVGTEVGGAECGSNGMTISFKLLYSQVGITLSTAQYSAAISDASTIGIQPQIQIRPSIKELLAGRDSVMEYVISDIGANKT